MKKILLIYFLIIANHSAQQNYPVFSELKGMEDQSGNTHLFYRLYRYWTDDLSFTENNDVYHLDIISNVDSFFLSDFSFYHPMMGPKFVRISDLEFWNDTPAEFIYCGEQGAEDGAGFIQRYDMEYWVNVPSFYVNNVEISQQNDSLLYAEVHNIFRSTDGGRSWEEYLTDGLRLVSLSPFNDQIIFASENFSLFKSTNNGINFFIVDTSHSNDTEFLYDSNGSHIYSVLSNSLKISNSEGNAFTWIESYSSSNPISVSLDYSQSGDLYIADGRYIYQSTDYGQTFNEYKVLDRKIVGIYKKPNSDKLYAATKYDLYEITPDTIFTLKHLSPNPNIFSWYPLKIGNKWVYEHTVEMYSSRFAVEVVDDTLITGKYFYKIKRYNLNDATYYYERIDSSNGKVYRYISESENQIYDFAATDVGDTVFFNEEEDYEIGWVLEYEEQFNGWGLNSTKRIFSSIIPSSGYRLYTFIKDIGLYRDEGGEVLYSTAMLKGFVKDGIAYGDLSLVGVDDDNEVQKEFSLSQNYPNPFNPNTSIQYAVGVRQFVSLKVYDVLGREIATLVNEEKLTGEYEVEFDASQLSSGIYFYKLQTENHSSTRKMIYLK